jgi:hypothetical protein
MSASDKPFEREVRKLIDSFDRCAEPILIHCNSGSDRTGFASACFLLLRTSTPLREARAQLSLRYGHVALGRAACQGRILDQYQAWLSLKGLDHSCASFRHWAHKVYQKDDWPGQVERTVPDLP